MNFLMPHSPKQEISINKNGVLNNLSFVLKDMCKIKGLKTSCGNPDFYVKCSIAEDHAPFLNELLKKNKRLIVNKYCINICPVL